MNESTPPTLTTLDSSKLPGSFDAREWAKEFVEIVKQLPRLPTDEDAMATWFANALMSGYDHARRKYEGKPWIGDPDSPEMREIINLLGQGSDEIRFLRQRKEVLDARVDTFMCMMDLLHATPRDMSYQASPDVAHMMRKKIEELKGQK